MTHEEIAVLKAELRNVCRSLDELKTEVKAVHKASCSTQTDHLQRLVALEEQSKTVKTIGKVLLGVFLTQLIHLIFFIIGG